MNRTITFIISQDFLFPMKAVTFAAIVAVCALLILQPGLWLIVNNPEKSDAIIVLGGDVNDVRYRHGLELLRAGYGQHLIVDVLELRLYGHSTADLARDFIEQTAGERRLQVSVCPIRFDSTKEETGEVAGCLARLQPPPHSVLLVTSDYHTRRALSIFRSRLPYYHWSAAATTDAYAFGLPWWKEREWAKSYLLECQKLLFWTVWDRWRG